MNKQDKEKAEMIADEYIDREHQPQTYGGFVEALLTMSTLKEQQMIEKAKEFIATWFYEHPHTSWLICSDEFQDLDDCLERLEKEMKEEN